MPFLLALALLAQGAFVRGYTTPDPINADRFGIALPSGRYMVSLETACDQISVGQNVWVWAERDDEWQIQPLEGADVCAVQVWGRMSDVPCLQDSAGDCDVALDPPFAMGG
jgi:hypothetical protein